MAYLSRVNVYTIVVVSVVFFGFLDALSPLGSPLEAEATEYPYRVTLKLQKTAFSLNENINITVTVTNVGSENVTLYNSLDNPFNFFIRDENYVHVFCYANYHAVPWVICPIGTLAPGENLTATLIWNQIYDGSNAFSGLSFTKVPKGNYYVIGQFHGSVHGVDFELPALKITIL